nr:hypothetical protein [uncultured Campylobacter sp.]
MTSRFYGSVKFDLKFTVENGGKFGYPNSKFTPSQNLTLNLSNFKNPRSNLPDRFTLF